MCTLTGKKKYASKTRTPILLAIYMCICIYFYVYYIISPTILQNIAINDLIFFFNFNFNNMNISLKIKILSYNFDVKMYIEVSNEFLINCYLI